jgi:flavodoxin
MKALVIYDSTFGNTAQIAQAIGGALGSQEEVAIRQATTVQPEQLTGVNLLVVGSPTQGFRPTAAITKFLKEVAGQGLKGVQVAAFDTRISKSDIKSPLFRFIIDKGGYAAKRIANQLQQSGAELVVSPEGFFVEGKEGPLKAGERERAAEWAKLIVSPEEAGHEVN